MRTHVHRICYAFSTPFLGGIRYPADYEAWDGRAANASVSPTIAGPNASDVVHMYYISQHANHKMPWSAVNGARPGLPGGHEPSAPFVGGIRFPADYEVWGGRTANASAGPAIAGANASDVIHKNNWMNVSFVAEPWANTSQMFSPCDLVVLDGVRDIFTNAIASIGGANDVNVTIMPDPMDCTPTTAGGHQYNFTLLWVDGPSTDQIIDSLNNSYTDLCIAITGIDWCQVYTNLTGLSITYIKYTLPLPRPPTSFPAIKVNKE